LRDLVQASAALDRQRLVAFDLRLRFARGPEASRLDHARVFVAERLRSLRLPQRIAIGIFTDALQGDRIGQ
jgi:hypothetical protein